MKIFFIIHLINMIIYFNLFASQKMKLAVVTAGDQNDPFFSMVVDFMRLSCESLNIELKAIYANDDLKFLNDELKLAVSEKKYNVVILMNFKNQLIRMSQLLEENKIPFFIYNSGFDFETDEANNNIRFKYLIGEMLPKDEVSGYELAKIITKETGFSPDGKIHLLGIGGTIADQASIERVKGLIKFINESNGKVILDEIAYANWKREEASDKIKELHRLYPKSRGIWVANDEMALGVVNSFESIKFKSIIGGVDWTKEAIQSVKNKKMYVTMGGHFMDGGWIAILLYDYFHGIQFTSDLGFKITSWTAPIDQENISKYINSIGNKANWKKINFKKYSKFLNPQLKKYDFSEKALLSQFN
ncbi:ABC transporter substrate-binding protein [Silvanigrella sp.]|jgi:ABC-type sugar transport system substrate-binding protein|uniref:ABC transporter substrate-binding protein n=1 Tax=Silvanigrella sp. TaxID=2024976 RepID=UPI0037C762D3